MARPSPSPRELVRQVWMYLAVAGLVAGLAASTAGGSAVATLTLTGPPQPFATIAGLAGIAAGAADAAMVSVAVAGADALRGQAPPSRSADGLRGPVVFATAGGVPLHTPTDQIRTIGYHQAASQAALPFEPRGAPFTNRNVPSYTPLPATPGPDYAIMGNRRRGTHPASAVDIAVPHNVTLMSPITGTVETVSPYLLYGRYPDLIVTVVPDGRPDLRLVMIHLNGYLVVPGQRVVAGETPIAHTAMPFPFSSQIDEWAGLGPHVHMEMRRVG
ncbi:MAG TPA: M23 family metallopeptidase [Egibacteraceae bacterium]|jgi:murein DD-endopeptidase MepM/ murein hydrolase activator NlpD|nr:M23 family metallopeptidase [Egibacteraceae bacterium]